MAEQGTRTIRYTVRACSLSKLHPRRVIAGSYESAAATLACAHRVIRHSLELLHHANPRSSPKALYRLYLCRGDVPVIMGQPGIPFDADGAVEWEIQLMMAPRRSGKSRGLFPTRAVDLPLPALLLRQIAASRDADGSPPPGYGKVWPGAGGGEVSAVDAPASASLNVSGSNATVADESASVRIPAAGRNAAKA